MKLSEAIRLGAMLRPQAFYRFFDVLENREIGSCAHGAAAEACGAVRILSASICGVRFAMSIPQGPQLLRTFPILWELAQCECGFKESLDLIIPHLNDFHRWSRERIADWVEAVEREREASAQPAVQEVVAQ